MAAIEHGGDILRALKGALLCLNFLITFTEATFPFSQSTFVLNCYFLIGTSKVLFFYYSVDFMIYFNVI